MFFLNRPAFIKEIGIETLKKKILFYHRHYQSTKPLDFFWKNHFKKGIMFVSCSWCFISPLTLSATKPAFSFHSKALFLYIDKEVHHAISHATKQMNYVCRCQCLTQFNHHEHALTYSNARHLTIIHLPDGLQNKTKNRIKMRKYFQPYSLLLKILLTDKR